MERTHAGVLPSGVSLAQLLEEFQVAREDVRRRLESAPARRFGFGTNQARNIAGGSVGIAQ
eukprot:11853430-Alexandrium_andersonii.AAC.1